MKNLFTFLFVFFPFWLMGQTPNIVFILVDDMGWNGTSVQVSSTESGSKSDYYETPNLEQLASDGMTFSQGYAPAPKCSPTRCSILTGESPARNSFTETGNQDIIGKILTAPETVTAVPTSDITIAEWLKTLGLNYRTGHYGKWHLGSGGPFNNGFDFNDGNNNNSDGDAGDGIVVQTDPKKIIDLTDKGILFMQNAVTDGVPFYLQISHYAVHSLVETKEETLAYFNEKPSGTIHYKPDFAGMTEDLDEGIGLLLEEIEDLGIADDTYIIFLSDNGSSISDNEPLRRGKSFIYEGGIRVPFFIKGPNIPANSTCSVPVNGYDLFPTIAEWTGSIVALPSTLDGVSIAPLLLENPFSREEALYFHVPHYSGNALQAPRSAAVEGKYKLIVEYETGINYLYDLEANIKEFTNISAENSDIVDDLKIKLRNHLKFSNANMPTLNPTHPNFSGTAPDVDEDDLEDEWEFRELLSYTYSGSDDPDEDGDNNLTEFNNGTDPLVDETALYSGCEVTHDVTADLDLDANTTIMGSVSITGNSLIKAPTVVNFQAGNYIELQTGFEVQLGSNFTAIIDDCVPENTPIEDINGMSAKNNVNFHKDLNLKVSIYPNPANEYFNLKFEEDISTYDIKGVKIYGLNAVLVYQSEKFEEVIYVGGILKGTYFIQFDFGKTQLTKKIMIQ